MLALWVALSLRGISPRMDRQATLAVCGIRMAGAMQAGPGAVLCSLVMEKGIEGKK